MTPREQIEKEENLRFPPIKSIANSIIRAGFKEGAEYGYNLAIENVVKWLCMNMADVIYMTSKPMQNVSKPELINNLKQAMRL
jgi:hypothetical protein